MKKIILPIVLAIVLTVTAGTVFAKESKPKKVAENIPWNLSGAVMPVPPYGSGDIIGSDTASKLTLKQAKDDRPVKIKGKMSGLEPNTTYTVYISKPYDKYTCTGWNVTGSWGIAINYLGTDYIHITSLTQTGTIVTGTLSYPGNTKAITSGSVAGNTITIVADYTENMPGTLTLTGTIAGDGTMSGTWLDTWGGLNRTGTWTTTGGPAVKSCTGSTGWPGLLTSSIQPFTFTTNAEGKGKWKVKIKDSDVERPADFSAWINSNGGTILISDNGTINVGIPKTPKPPKDPK